MRWQYFVLAFCCLVLERGALAQDRISDEQIGTEITSLVRWRSYWEGQPTLRFYAPGKHVEISIIESPTEVAIFISEIGIAAYFGLKDGKITRRSIQSIQDTTNDSATARYLATYGGTPGFVFKDGTGPRPGDTPIRREDLSDVQRRGLLKQRALLFTLPDLIPPEYIRSRRIPPGMSQFESIVRARISDFYNRSCGGGKAFIPYFSVSDPTVYVYADLGKCGEGVFPFSRDEHGEWRSGQFSLAKLPNHWEPTIQRIRESTAIMLDLSAQQNASGFGR
jgi:hypothetical protein